MEERRPGPQTASRRSRHRRAPPAAAAPPAPRTGAFVSLAPSEGGAVSFGPDAPSSTIWGMWSTGIPAAGPAPASRFTFSTTFCSFACSGAPESANAPPSIITSFCRSCTTSAARAGSTLTCSLSLTASSSGHVAEPVAPDLHPDPVKRGRGRHIEIAPVVAAPVEVADVLGHLDHAEVLALRADHPDAARPGDVDVASLVALHSVGDPLLDHTRADAVEEHPPVRDRPVRLPVENADV